MREGLALQAQGVRMEYVDQATGERLLAIERLDLDITEGQFVSIVGPSGCGKSTFLKIVNGLFPATEGTIEIAVPGRPARPAGTICRMVSAGNASPAIRPSITPGATTLTVMPRLAISRASDLEAPCSAALAAA